MNDPEGLLTYRDSIAALIFDLNGTLLDDYHYNIEAFRMVFRKFDLDVPEKEIGSWFGKPTSYIIEQILKARGIAANYAQLAQEKVRYYLSLTQGRDVYAPGATETLERLRRRFRLALFTGVTRRQVELLGDVLDYFEVTVAGEEAIRPKPDPATLWYIAETMGLAPSQCAYVGDMPQDMELARNAGMIAIGIENALFSEEDLRKAGAHEVVRWLQDLAALLGV